MGKENKCEFFGTEENQCGFAKWLIEKPYSDINVPEVGCGKTNIDNCPRIVLNSPKLLTQYGPVFESEFDISLPANITNSKGEKKRLPGGTFK